MSVEQNKKLYTARLHAMQAGVGLKLERGSGMGSGECSPKHLRVGVNAALRDLGSLTALLVSKGLITEEEVWEALAKGMQEEKADYERRLSEETGVRITLL